MSVVSLLGVNILNNPAKFTDKYQFEITFECLEQLDKDLEWKLTYVGSANSDQYDQELDALLVGPIPIGVNKFIFEADAPDTKRIPDAEVLGVTVVLLTCAYDEREFVRVGYYVNNEYESEELAADPPAKPIIEKIRRNILAEKPRVTRFAIKWDNDATAPSEFPPEQPEADMAPDEDEYGAEVDDDAEDTGDLEEAGEEAIDNNGEASAPSEDAALARNAAENVERAGEDDEMSQDGSVDLDGESEDEIEDDEDEELEGHPATIGDGMDVDMEDAPDAGQNPPQS